MRILQKILKITVVIINILIFNQCIFSQTIYTEFGKNRVQFSDDFDDWWYYDTDHYTIYWYGKERNIAKSVILESQNCYDDIENILDFKLNRKIQLILYSDIQDLNQSNIGIKDFHLDSSVPF
ncbi:MAG: hypothetical protein R2771_08010 [Saprospiraceae bacterium]